MSSTPSGPLTRSIETPSGGPRPDLEQARGIARANPKQTNLEKLSEKGGRLGVAHNAVQAGDATGELLTGTSVIDATNDGLSSAREAIGDHVGLDLPNVQLRLPNVEATRGSAIGEGVSSLASGLGLNLPDAVASAGSAVSEVGGTGLIGDALKYKKHSALEGREGLVSEYAEDSVGREFAETMQTGNKVKKRSAAVSAGTRVVAGSAQLATGVVIPGSTSLAAKAASTLYEHGHRGELDRHKQQTHMLRHMKEGTEHSAEIQRQLGTTPGHNPARPLGPGEIQRQKEWEAKAKRDRARRKEGQQGPAEDVGLNRDEAIRQVALAEGEHGHQAWGEGGVRDRAAFMALERGRGNKVGGTVDKVLGDAHRAQDWVRRKLPDGVREKLGIEEGRPAYKPIGPRGETDDLTLEPFDA